MGVDAWIRPVTVGRVNKLKVNRVPIIVAV